MSSDIHQGSLERHAAPVPEPTAREKRWERRRKRRLFEEIAGWVLVPVILLGGYWLLTIVLGAMGTSPSAIIAGVQALLN